MTILRLSLKVDTIMNISIESKNARIYLNFQVELLKKKDPYGHYKLVGEEALGELFHI